MAREFSHAERSLCRKETTGGNDYTSQDVGDGIYGTRINRCHVSVPTPLSMEAVTAAVHHAKHDERDCMHYPLTVETSWFTFPNLHYRVKLLCFRVK